MRELIIDTNVLYYGIHTLCYMGHSIVLPECVVSEVERRVYEAVKKGRLEDTRELLDSLAYLSLREVMTLRPNVFPTAGHPCDTAIPRIDPYLVTGKILVTGDDGAYRRWSVSPAAKLAEIHRAKVDIRSAPDWEGLSEDSRYWPRVYHSLSQLLIALRLAQESGVIDKVEVAVQSRRVDVPIKPILRELGIQTETP